MIGLVEEQERLYRILETIAVRSRMRKSMIVDWNAIEIVGKRIEEIPNIHRPRLNPDKASPLDNLPDPAYTIIIEYIELGDEIRLSQILNVGLRQGAKVASYILAAWYATKDINIALSFVLHNDYKRIGRACLYLPNGHDRKSAKALGEHLSRESPDVGGGHHWNGVSKELEDNKAKFTLDHLIKYCHWELALDHITRRREPSQLSIGYLALNGHFPFNINRSIVMELAKRGNPDHLRTALKELKGYVRHTDLLKTAIESGSSEKVDIVLKRFGHDCLAKDVPNGSTQFPSSQVNRVTRGRRCQFMIMAVYMDSPKIVNELRRAGCKYALVAELAKRIGSTQILSEISLIPDD